MRFNNHRNRTFEEKRITHCFNIAKGKFRLVFSPKENTNKVSILLDYHISDFGPILKKIINLKVFAMIKIYTKSEFIDEDDEINNKLISQLLNDDYSHHIRDLNLIRNSQDESFSLFCVLQKINKDTE